LIAIFLTFQAPLLRPSLFIFAATLHVSDYYFSADFIADTSFERHDSFRSLSYFISPSSHGVVSRRMLFSFLLFIAAALRTADIKARLILRGQAAF